ncbi:ethanolamine ammonia-lyase small subunit [Pigmentiphaga litoralis]|uniref:Ethanolamine ammonia-lyase small subunit n=1 Tax=Pigmentiphaga litoralis TaxID=516702 RepID=A0A7Y9IXR0_9BURK|nr:ethanolamine ammonia-lyase subunit EutC [Pigmentiphaga litoralis]NYE25846.1 ethanolamine ammonia-lyase small subunit [Pigmentiphaga litoralis]NYE84966.1 ethanolamine ammonia-lyase small subunit [Pigmentiphaga litoralis]
MSDPESKQGAAPKQAGGAPSMAPRNGDEPSVPRTPLSEQSAAEQSAAGQSAAGQSATEHYAAGQHRPKSSPAPQSVPESVSHRAPAEQSVSRSPVVQTAALPPPADDPLVQPDPWDALRAHTSARIAIGRVGGSLPSAEVLRFGLAHARARDAVHHPLNGADLATRLRTAGFRVAQVRSQAPDRQTYLLRPDLGRRLHDDDRDALLAAPPAPELAFVLADGLSTFAVERHALPLLEAMRERFTTDWAATPVVMVDQGRVAVGDDIGEALQARMVVVLVGERPGLTSPDSLGIYFTYQPRTGRMDSERNCISNVRPEGLPVDAAADKLSHMLRQSLTLQLSGVGLKDDSEAPEVLKASATVDVANAAPSQRPLP